MAEIPTANRRRELTRDVAGPLREPQLEGESDRQAAEISDRAAKVAQGFQKLRSYERATRDSVEAAHRIRGIEESAMQDPDPGSGQNYEAQLQDVEDEVSGDILDAETRAEFKRRVALDRATATFRIRDFNRKRTLDFAFAGMEERLNQNVNDFVRAGNSLGLKSAAIRKAQEEIDTATSAGIIDARDGHRRKEQIEREMAQADLNDLIRSDPNEALKRLNQSFYKQIFGVQLDSATQKDLQEFADKAKTRLEKENKRLQEIEWDKNENAMYEKYKTGTLTLHEINEAEALGELGREGGIPKSFSTSMRGLLKETSDDPDVSAEDKAGTYAELLSEYSRLKRKQEKKFGEFGKKSGVAKGNEFQVIRDFREKVIHNAKYLTNKERNDFIEATQGDFDKQAARAQASGMIQRHADLESGIIIESAHKASQLFSKLIQETKEEGIPPDQIVDKAVDLIERDKKVSNPNRARYKVGDVINTRSGAHKVVGFDEDGEPLVERMKGGF